MLWKKTYFLDRACIKVLWCSIRMKRSRKRVCKGLYEINTQAKNLQKIKLTAKWSQKCSNFSQLWFNAL